MRDCEFFFISRQLIRTLISIHRTGRRVLTREERQERKRLEGGADAGPSGLWDDKKDVKGFGDQPMLHIGGSAALNSSNPADSHPMGHMPSSRPTTITAPPPYAVPRGGGAAPSTSGRVSRRNSRVRDRSNTATGRHAAPGPSPLTDQPKPGGAIAAAAQANRLVDKLEDVSFTTDIIGVTKHSLYLSLDGLQSLNSPSSPRNRT